MVSARLCVLSYVLMANRGEARWLEFRRCCHLSVVLGSALSSGAMAQQINGTPGSPGATIIIDGKQLPPPPLKFGGVIEKSAKDSKPWWPPRVVPPKGAPNILLIMTGDQGWCQWYVWGCYSDAGLDRIAKAGLRYTQFNSTALCSPTRAALITGRNHHSTGNGVIGELKATLCPPLFEVWYS
jgi:Sulfatase